MTTDNEHIISHTKNWISKVVVACNFCPFAAREVQRGTIHYEVMAGADMEQVLATVAKMFQQLDTDKAIETSLLILPDGFADFDSYLELVDLAEKLLEQENYEGVYQLASFHPQYLFAGSNNNDPSNYTNRSPYPMLHFLREDSVTIAVDSHPDIDAVPERNIRFTQEKGLLSMKALLASCFNEKG